MPEIMIGRVVAPLKDDLITSEKGFALDASQGKVLDNKITVLNDKVDFKPLHFKTETDKPSAYPKGVTIFYDYLTKWNGYQYVTIRTTKFENNSCFQELLDSHRGKVMYFRGSDGSDGSEWSAWTVVATTDKIDILFLNGWTNELGVAGATVCGNSISIGMMIKGGVTTSGTILFNLPIGFRPKHNTYITAQNGYSYKNILIEIFPNGNAIISTENITDNNRIIINCILNM